MTAIKWGVDDILDAMLEFDLLAKVYNATAGPPRIIGRSGSRLVVYVYLWQDGKSYVYDNSHNPVETWSFDDPIEAIQFALNLKRQESAE